MGRRGKRTTLARSGNLWLFGRAALSFITRLFYEGSPAAIPRRIGPIVVYAIKRKTGRVLAHIAQERLEVMEPFVAHCYSAASIILVMLIRWIKATVLSSTPALVSWRVASTVAVIRIRPAPKASADTSLADTDLPFASATLTTKTTTPRLLGCDQGGCEAQPAHFARFPGALSFVVRNHSEKRFHVNMVTP
jgi:hypothetical protein